MNHLPSDTPRPAGPLAQTRGGKTGLALICGALLAACAAPPPPMPQRAPDCAAAASAPQATAAAAEPVPPAPDTVGAAAPVRPIELRTHNAVYRSAAFDDLPGWRQDDLRGGWNAFLMSCAPLQQRPAWRDICRAARAVPPGSDPAIHSFFESRFTVMRILNSDTSREGDITGYFEPLLEGRAQRGDGFEVPVLGVPADLRVLDWARVPAAQRRQVIQVRPEGNRLAVVPAGTPGSYALDMRRHTLDDRDRRLRVRLVRTAAGDQAVPYPSRGELEALGLPARIGAPVLAWVDDPLALYAMQVQGSGRIKLADGSVLRLQYAEQNGHPFKPLRVVPVPKPVTRGTSMEEVPERFTLEDEAPGAPDTAPAADGPPPVLTRGTRRATAQATPPDAGAADGLVDELLKGAPRPSARPPARRPAAKAAAATSLQRLNADPSYVFFKKAGDDRGPGDGPQGALGVPLTAGRSVAVDPRVTPLGYPVYLSAAAPPGSRLQVRRLVFAQDTGGAIRGALRADYFWGFGNEAGQSARRTRHRGEMWLMLPHAEAARLADNLPVTRGLPVAGSTDQDCLVADGEFCSEVDQDLSAPNGG